MDSVGSPEEEGNLNTPLPTPYTINSYYSYPTFLEQVLNWTDKIITVIENDVSEAKNGGATETV